MQRIPKTLLDAHIEANRTYWENGEKSQLRRMSQTAKDIEQATQIDMFAISNFVCSIVKPNGIAPEATNEVIYSALLAIGCEVVDDK